MRKIAIIPARGGSKRIPGKNIKDFLGKPIIAYSIQTALDSDMFDEVMVSTDSKEIAEIAEKLGAKVPFFRSTENANDFATTIDVLLEVLEKYKEIGQEFEIGCCIYPTAPFVNIELLNKSLSMLIQDNLDSAFPILPFSFPIQRALKMNKKNKVEMFQPEHMMSRSQDLEKGYHDAGQFYWFKVDSFLKEKKMWMDNTSGIVLNEMKAQDIDTLEDWKVAELKYQLMINEKNNG